MNLYMRLFWTLLHSTYRKPIQHVLDEATLPLRVFPNDLDTNWHMNNGRYLTLMDLGRLDLLAAMGLWWPSVRKRWVAVLGASQMVHLKELKVFESFKLKSRLECWDERWFVIVQRFVVRGRVHAIGRVRGQVHGPRGRVSPEEFLRLAKMPQISSPQPSEATTLWLESLRANRREETQSGAKKATEGMSHAEG